MSPKMIYISSLGVYMRMKGAIDVLYRGYDVFKFMTEYYLPLARCLGIIYGVNKSINIKERF